jgi:hypothetical protein
VVLTIQEQMMLVKINPKQNNFDLVLCQNTNTLMGNLF